MDSTRFQPLVKIFPHKINVFYYNLNRRCYPKDQGLNLREDRKKAFQGFLSESAKRIIEERLSCWYQIVTSYNKLSTTIKSKNFKRLVFVTLTLSSKQLHTDKFIKEKLLEQFIKLMQEHYRMKNYFWKAEKQKNGNIHFHLLTDIYCPYEEINRFWNQVQEYHGYTKDYYSKFKHNNPPSTHIEVVNQQQNAIKYLMKYVSKVDTALMIDGRCWSMSNSIKAFAVPVQEIDSHFEDFLLHVKESTKVNEFHKDYFSVLRFSSNIDITKFKYYNCKYLHGYYSRLGRALYDLNFEDDEIELFVEYVCDRALFKENYDLFLAAGFRSDRLDELIHS